MLIITPLKSHIGVVKPQLSNCIKQWQYFWKTVNIIRRSHAFMLWLLAAVIVGSVTKSAGVPAVTRCASCLTLLLNFPEPRDTSREGGGEALQTHSEKTS